jgi:cysteine dioxygenase
MEWKDCLTHILCGLKTPSVAELRRALQQLDCSEDDLRPYVTEPAAGRSYGRNVLFRTADVEAIVVHIPPGAATAIHDHGESVGCALVVEGRLHNALYRSVGYGMACEEGSIIAQTGSFIIAPKGQIHQMRNLDGERFVSLHLYAPPLTRMRQYVPAEEAVLDYVI